jgi:c(7)-type cytochrome triheme protein
MRRFGYVLAAVMLAAGLAGRAGAVPPGFSIEFDGNGEGKVTFTGAKHTGPGMHCSNCHMGIFYVSRSAPITRADHKRKNFCFVCHDGKTAFAARQNCDRCHVEPDVVPPEQVPAAALPAATTQ